MKSRNFSKLSLFVSLMLISLAPYTAFAGNSSGGGGIANSDGTIIDIYETTVNPLAGAKKFSPTEYSAFHDRLMPLMNRLADKVPLAPKEILSGLERMDWYLVDQKSIAESNDQCALLKSDNIQVAKQIGNRVVVSKEWLQGKVNKKDDTNIAALFLHELVMNLSKKDPASCSTDVREAVNAVFNQDQKSEAELRQAFQRLVPYPASSLFATKSELRQTFEIVKPDLEASCSENKVNILMTGTIALTDDSIRINEILRPERELQYKFNSQDPSKATAQANSHEACVAIRDRLKKALTGGRANVPMMPPLRESAAVVSDQYSKSSQTNVEAPTQTGSCTSSPAR